MKWNFSIAKNPYFQLLGIAWKYAGKEKKQYLIVYGMFILSNIAHGLTPILWGWFIDDLQRNGTAVIRSVWIYAGSYLLLHFIDWGFHGRARVKERVLAFNMSKNFLEEMYHKAIHLPVKWHQDNHSGATINRIRKAYEALNDFFQNGFMYLGVIAKLVFSIGAILYFSPKFGLIAIGLGVLIVWIIMKFDKPFIAALNETNEKQHIVSSTLFDSLSNIITVITLRLQKSMQTNVLQKVSDVFPPFKRKVVINEWKWFVVDTCVVMIYFITLVGFVYQNHVPGEIFLIGGLVTLMSYVERFTGVFHDVAWQYTQIVQYHTDISTASNIMESYEKEHLPESELSLPNDWQTIHINQLSFNHNTGSEEAANQLQGLKDIDIILEKGKKIALIGESGSGKSTLLALLRGLYQPQSGSQIKVDHQKSHDSIDVIADQVTLFPQEPEIFENTIEYNITLGLPFDRKELEAITETVHFTEVVESLPNGYESNIKEKGVNLSGGQKQRLALARGVIAAKTSNIILLDEPTSSVDPKTELEIYDKLFKAFSNKVVVSALHRLHLLSKFDYVYILDKGQVVDQGTFKYLRANSPIFKALWKHQEQLMINPRL